MNALALLVLAQTTLVVTNTNDSGSGSLRAAIEGTYGCRPVCAISFNIPGPGPWHTIKPERPLPPMLIYTTIVGGSQTTFGGNTNPDGPEIELNGSLLREGSGLHLCGGNITGLAINGFPENGLTLGGDHCTSFGVTTLRGGGVSDNYIGTDPTGRVAVPNSRGIWMSDLPFIPQAQYAWSITRNVVSGNRHSGIFIQKGPAKITRNTIGLTAKRDGPLGNGASGVAIMENGSGTDVDDNYIGFNHHFGVGIQGGTKHIALHGNSFQANWGLAIDYGFDGASTVLPDAVDVPTILQARYEQGATIIEAVLPNHRYNIPTLTYYASDAPDPSGYGEGQYVLGIGGRTFRCACDLRGKWITATATVHFYYGALPATNGDYFATSTSTSEFSRAVQVH
ncbi:MAG TPA: right-handed parallel beta-helix repeat-containing protein [Thermoanaerobaculia bacterium]|nr:right-handed parallel beta-helix repeat-containing protein [Thermoanaerobaculia bacterium]